MTEARPDPEALLRAAAREGKGRLKVFLGAAPGVGKTYEMLMSGRARLADGVDVVIGVVETHGRKETLALVEGYEVIPRRKVDYKGRILDEMDIDAILAVRRATGRRVTAAGGITSWDEIDELDAQQVDAVVGMAVYTGQLPLDRYAK